VVTGMRAARYHLAMKVTKKTIRRSVRRAGSASVPRPSEENLLSEAGIDVLQASELPIVGITISRSDPEDPGADAEGARLSWLVQSLGGVPLLLPPVASIRAIRRHAGLVDGVLLPAGAGIHPNFLGQAPVKGARYDPRKDRYEWQLFDQALEVDLPVLGIGRGFALMNLFLGGTLAGMEPFDAAPGPADLAESKDAKPGDGGAAEKIRVVPGTRLARAIGSGTYSVSSSDCDRIAELADPLMACAHGSHRSIEAAEMVDRDFVIGARFDVDASDGAGKRLAQALVGAAKTRATSRSRRAGDRAR
jgi:putative glutamine amidotransferase